MRLTFGVGTNNEAEYWTLLAGLEGVHGPRRRGDVELSWFVYVVRLDDACGRDDRDRVIRGLRARGIGCRDYFPPIHLQSFYRERFGYAPGDFPVTDQVFARSLALPLHDGLDDGDPERVVECLREVLHEAGAPA